MLKVAGSTRTIHLREIERSGDAVRLRSQEPLHAPRRRDVLTTLAMITGGAVGFGLEAALSGRGGVDEIGTPLLISGGALLALLVVAPLLAPPEEASVAKAPEGPPVPRLPAMPSGGAPPRAPRGCLGPDAPRPRGS